MKRDLKILKCKVDESFIDEFCSIDFIFIKLCERLLLEVRVYDLICIFCSKDKF